MGAQVVCPACRETSNLFPKGVGHHPYQWEMNCSICHCYAVGLDAYIAQHTEVVKELERLRERYLNGESTQGLANQIEDLAKQFDGILSNRECECGGALSIAAKPKCIHCDIEIFDSYFHVADERSEDNQA